MSIPSCSLWILVARTDLPFMLQTIPHLVKMSNFPFQEKVLVIDTAPLSGDKINRPGVGTMEQLREYAEQLHQMGVVDRLTEVNYNNDYRDRLYQKHFGTKIRQTHNYKGYPILGTIFTIEEPKSDYMLHFDSDMLLHQAPNYNWITESIKLIENHPELMSMRPLTGPPSADGKLYQSYPYDQDQNGFYRFKFFSSRVYLIKKQRFDELLPLPIIWRSYRNQWLNKLPLPLQNSLNYLTGKGKLDSWEIMVSKQLERTKYYRGVLANSQAWTLHPIDRSPKFIAALPEIIARIEAGDYPPEQAGYYDLKSQFWL